MNEPFEQLGQSGYPDERQIRNPYTLQQQVRRMLWWIG
jgi:hypothetical protein